MQSRVRIGFWNVAGVSKKDREFWKEIEEWDIVGLVETWVEEKGWTKIKESLPRGFRWECQTAKRLKKKGRAIGGVITGVREGLEEVRKGKEAREHEGIVCRNVVVEGRNWKIVTVYVNGDMDEKIREIKETIGEKSEEGLVIVGGDFNARTGTKGAMIMDGKIEEEGRRKSKDKKLDGNGKKMIKWIEEEGWGILNGEVDGDEEGEFTFIGGVGESVIDYAIANIEMREKVESMKIEWRVESDHLPLVVTVTAGGVKKPRKARKTKMVCDWSKVGTGIYKKEMEKAEIATGETVEERLGRIKEVVRKAMVKKEVRIGRGEGKNRWWDEECKEMKRQLRESFRKWRRGKCNKQTYRECKKTYEVMCEEKREKEREKMLNEAMSARTEAEVWKIVNKERKTWKGVDEGIGMEEWSEYFRDLLNGYEEFQGQEREGESGKGKTQENKEERRDIELEEVWKVVKDLKEGKAAGADELQNEIWKYGGKKLLVAIGELFNKVWRGEGFPKEWQEGLIVPIRKKGGGKKTSDYRGITLMPTLYKIYAQILARRLEKEVEAGGMVPENQTGFRKGRGTMENCYVLNYCIGREIKKKKGKLIALFVDLKAAFDEVDRDELWKSIKKRGVSDQLRERIEELYKETRCRVKVGEEVGKEFWTFKGVRQGCPLSPMLFSLFTADLEEEMKKGLRGGIVVGGERIWSLAYADDIVLVAKEEEDMAEMMRRLERYLKGKKLRLNTEKSKIIRFRKGGGRSKEVVWKWKGERIEEVKDIKYLGYTVQRTGRQEAHIREVTRRATAIMGQVWGIGKRKFGGDWVRRMKLFDALVRSIIGYGAEIWGWVERSRIEKVQEKYLRWTLGVDWRTPGYIVRDESKREKIRLWAGRRALRFEQKLRLGGGSDIARRCLKEIEEKQRGQGSKWEEGRRRFFEDRGYSCEAAGLLRAEGIDVGKVMEERDRELQEQEKWGCLREARYNRWYREVRTERLPRYLRDKGKEERRIIIARFRLGNEMLEGRYWENEEERMCRMCGSEMESWEHVLTRCMDGGEGFERERVRELLDEKGGGYDWLKSLMEKRKEKTTGTE